MPSRTVEPRKRSRAINLNLSREYCPDWDLFEGLREFYSNALDADPNPHVEFSPSGNQIRITTDTRPSLSQMCIIGHGTKSASSDTIGQFGEGSKVGALALTRRRNTSVRIELHEETIFFDFRKPAGFDIPVLHAVLGPPAVDAPTGDRCRVVIDATDIKSLFSSHFLKPGTGYGPLEKLPGTRGMRVFVRGILIKRVEESSLYDWNLKSLRINRDRSVPDAWDLKQRIGMSVDNMLSRGDTELARTLLLQPTRYEAKAFDTIHTSQGAAAVMAQSFESLYGNNAVIASSDTRTNSLAEARGAKTIVVPQHLANVLAQAPAIKKASSFRELSDDLVQVPEPPCLDFLTPILNIIGIPVEIKVFEDNTTHAGRAEVSSNLVRVWLNENLFQPGNRLELCRTLCHEIAHVKGGEDITTEFEWSLDFVAGKLAEHIIS